VRSSRKKKPLRGFRGASRYYDVRYAEGFALECAALARVRRDMGLVNVKVMIPFCRTVEEAKRVIAVMAAHGLRQGENGLEVYAMCELPANVVLADAFLAVFDGYSIGSNDLAQLTLGLDRDSETVAHLFDERNPAVQQMIVQAIGLHNVGKPIGICGYVIRLPGVRCIRRTRYRLDFTESGHGDQNRPGHCQGGSAAGQADNRGYNIPTEARVQYIMISSACLGRSKIGQGARGTTCWATLPMSIWCARVRPCVPIMMRSTCWSRAVSRIP
jgi:hypothetical protein